MPVPSVNSTTLDAPSAWLATRRSLQRSRRCRSPPERNGLHPAAKVDVAQRDVDGRDGLPGPLVDLGRDAHSDRGDVLSQQGLDDTFQRLEEVASEDVGVGTV